MTDTLVTASGLCVDPEAIKPEEIRVYDVAWALHHNNLFMNGHAPVPWDVLSHTGLMYLLYVQDTKGKTTIPTSLGVMLYCADEAYPTDKDDTFYAICGRFGIDPVPDGNVDWNAVERYDKQARAIEFTTLFPALKDSKVAPQFVYHLDRLPRLVKAKVEDYVGLLKHLSINHGVEDIATLFAFPDALKPYMAAELAEATAGETDSNASLNIEVRETKSVEDLRV